MTGCHSPSPSPPPGTPSWVLPRDPFIPGSCFGSPSAGSRLVPATPPGAVGGDIWFCPRSQAVFRCPDQVWHVELLPQPRQLYILCAHSGIYCVSLEQQSR